MGYRGEDLDLRTPQTWSGGADTPAEAARSWRGGARSAPLWVDDVVLACCNHAFDVAAAHRCEEVRIEHLLHALTRIEAAAEVLQARGVRVAPLRRESATIIASEIPISPAPPGTPPRRSNEMAEVLRLAASEASRRNAPAGVADLLEILLDGRPDMPGVALLSRNTTRPQPESPEPPMRPHHYVSEPRYSDREPPREASLREWTRRSAASHGRGSFDSLSAARIDGIERALDTIGAELSDDRGMLMDVMQDLRRELASQREEQARIAGTLNERLSLIEQIVTSQPSQWREGEKVVERLRAVEGGLDHRLNELARSWSGVSDRLHALEQAVREPHPLPLVDLAPLEARISNAEATIRESRASEQQAWLGLADRLKSLETVLTQPSGLVDMAPIGHRLDVIEEALLGRDSEPARELAERTRALEASVAAHRAQTLETSASIAAEIKALAGTMTTQTTQVERMQSLHSDRLQVLAGLVDRHRTELAGTVVDPLLARVQGLANALEVRHGQIGQHVTTLQQRVGAIEKWLGERITTLEAGLRQSAQAVAEGQAGLQHALGGVTEALVRMQGSQQRIAGDVEKWHAEAAGDIGVIANKLATMERESTKPLKMIEAMSAGIDRVQRIAVERERRRSRFWYWLFGTEDWQGSSWPEAVASVERKRTESKKHD